MTYNVLFRTLGFCLLLAFSACVDDPFAPGATVEVGTGVGAFSSLEEGEDVRLDNGFQGGHHVWVAVRGRGVGERAQLRLEIQPVDESAPAAQVQVRTLFGPEIDGARDFLGTQLVIDAPECWVDQRVRLRAELRSGDQLLVDEREVRLVAGEFPPGPCER